MLVGRHVAVREGPFRPGTLGFGRDVFRSPDELYAHAVDVVATDGLEPLDQGGMQLLAR